MVRAGEASGSLGQIFERLSEFERSRDELRSYIISSMIYPSLLAFVGAGRSSCCSISSCRASPASSTTAA
jgi:type II secretory pathway component PulF